MSAARAEQPGDALNRLARIDAEIIGDIDDIVLAQLRALGGLSLTLDELLGEGPAPGGAAGAAVGAGE